MKATELYSTSCIKQRGTLFLFVFLLFLLLTGCAVSPKETEPQGDPLAAGIKTLPSEALQLIRADYDGDGQEEAFAVLLDGDTEELPHKVWFVNSEGSRVVDGVAEFDLGTGEVLETSTRKFAHFEANYATGTSVILLTVRNGEPVLEPVVGQGFTQTDGDEFVLWQNALDASYMDGMSLGRTEKPYWLYWDAEADSFREYGGSEISREALSALPGGEALLAQIDEELALEEGQIDNILLRGNGSVQVNCTLHYQPDDGSGNSSGDCCWYSIWTDGTETSDALPEKGEGIYLPALLPELAVYPENVEP